MILQKTFLIFCTLLSGLYAFAQSSFVRQQEIIFSLAENQEMCRQVGISAGRPDCLSSGKIVQLPVSDTLFFCDVPVVTTESERALFEQLLFPDGSCRRFMTLASLCDLYFPLFQKKLNSRGLHKDFRWIPLVVSGCNVSYKSTSGKAGLWAMDYLVARKYHLRVDKLIDERCGGDFTTDAASAHLKDLIGRCDGRHDAALIAYFSGMPALNQLQEGGSDLLARADQTVAYQIKFLAYVKTVMESARVDNRLQNYFDVFGNYESVFCENDIRFEAINALMGIDTKELREWNPVYCGDVIVGDYKKIPFMIDATKVIRFSALQDSLANWQPQIIVETEIVETTYISYKVKRGDSLGKIAQKYNISVSELKRLNRIKGNTIQQGKVLKIPVTRKVVAAKDKADPTAKDLPAVSSEAPKPDSTAKSVGEAPVANVVKKPVREQENKVVYVVKSGDSLWKIAKKYKGVTEKDIMKWNKIGENLRPGQRLIIYPGK